MTFIDPISSNAIASATTAPTTQTNNANQFGKDTFLKLLVAQLKYQNPMSPADGTQFLAQTAQFTMVEKLNEISTLVKSTAAANEVLEANAMIDKMVTVATAGGSPAVTTVQHIGGNLSSDAAIGSRASIETNSYTSKGTKIPMTVEFTRLADGSDGSHHWTGKVMMGKSQVGTTFAVDFNAAGERTSPDPRLTRANLDTIPDTRGLWDEAGIRLDLGSAAETSRLRCGPAGSSISTSGQNGTDGKTVVGIATGTRFTADGPLLRINGKEYSLGNVTEVHVAA